MKKRYNEEKSMKKFNEILEEIWTFATNKEKSFAYSKQGISDMLSELYTMGLSDEILKQMDEIMKDDDKEQNDRNNR